MPAAIENIDIPSFALKAIETLENAGFEAWCVGGFVRDALIGRDSHDIDIASDAAWEEARSVFDDADIPTFETGVAHGTLTAFVDGRPIEITTFRADGTYSDARHPDTVSFVKSIREDLARRDFTINALAYHPERGLIDPFGGQEDLAEGIVRTVGDPALRFAEDALRILRAARFSAQLGFSIDETTLQCMRAHSAALGKVAAERIRHELEGLLCGAHAHRALMGCADILASVMPEIEPMRGFDQRTPYHIYDVYEHTAYVVQNTPPYPLVRWAALFHDMGKPDTFFADETGRGHFYGHAEESIKKADAIMHRLKMSPRFVDDVLVIVRYHDTHIEAQPKYVKRALHRLGGRVDLFRALCDIKRGDALSQAPRCAGRVKEADELSACLDEVLAASAAFSLKDLAIDGNDVLSLGIEPGPLVRRLLEEALYAVIDEKVPNEHDALRAHLEASAHRNAPEDAN